jgi:phosphatidylserine/phosphatidylglycerophosphate/cardiolipin synthase-like enzyme
LAKFINTRKAVSEIEDLIRSAGERLILVSPYLKLSKDFRQLLEYRNAKDKVTVVVFGKQELKPDEMRFLQGLRFVVLKFNEDLHAKCYANDDRMIITSLNLYEFSMANNKEMGVLIDRSDPADAQLFKDAMDEVDFIQSTSQRFDFVAPKAEAPPKPVEPVAKARTAEPAPRAAERSAPAKSAGRPTGYCIRTGVEIPFNIEKPLSYDAYKKWSQYGDADYAEKFCHFSGEPSHGETSVSRPILKKNWKKAQEVHGVR